MIVALANRGFDRWWWGGEAYAGRFGFAYNVWTQDTRIQTQVTIVMAGEN